MKNNKLSHSSVQKYMACGEMYRLHYEERLRPITSSSNLFFGSAVDLAINSLLLKDGKDPKAVFDEAWSNGTINKKTFPLAHSLQVIYSKKDLDIDLLTESDLSAIHEYVVNNNLEPYINNPDQIVEALVARKANEEYEPLSTEEKTLYNFINWLSLRRKGHLLLEAYATEVVPRIKEVKAVQKEVNFSNDEGDSIVGFIDLIAVLDDGKEYILDNKTSSKPYRSDAIEKSEQLSLYSVHENNPNVGYFVLIKEIRKHRTCTECGKSTDNGRLSRCDSKVNKKRCNGVFSKVLTPKARVQTLLGTANQSLCNSEMENFEQVNSLIKQGVFQKNLNTCANYFGARCPYFSKCHEGSDEGLEVVE